MAEVTCIPDFGDDATLLRHCQQLAEDVRIGTGVVGTHVACWVAERREFRLLADSWDIPLHARTEVAPGALREQPDSDEAKAKVDTWYRHLYLAAEALVIKVEELCGTLLSDASVRLLTDMWGGQYTLLCPLQVAQHVSGVVFLHSPRPFTTRQRQRCQRVVRLAGSYLFQGQVEQTLTEARRRVILTEEAQRKSVAEWLHGRVQTRLLVLEHTLSSMLESAPESLRERLVWVKEELAKVREHEVRGASHRLHPAAVRLGLLAAVRSLAASVPETLMVDVHADEAVQQLDRELPEGLPEHLKLTVYRLIEEALSNVVHHAKARCVTIELALSREEIALLVRDNGCGFDPQTTARGLGLHQIADRVADAGGRWQLKSTPGKGTSVYVALPWKVPAEFAHVVTRGLTLNPGLGDFLGGR